MARMEAFETPFFAPRWRRLAIVLAMLLAGLALYILGFAYTGLVLCAAAFWLGYELLVIYDIDTGRPKDRGGSHRRRVPRR